MVLLEFAVNAAISHGIVEHHVLFGQLQQHRVVEELADAHILAQALWRTQKKLDIIKKIRQFTSTFYRSIDEQVVKRLTLRLRVLIMNSLARWGAG